MKGLCPELEPLEFWQTLRRCPLKYPYLKWIHHDCPDYIHEIQIPLPLGGVIEIGIWHFTTWFEAEENPEVEERSSCSFWLYDDRVHALLCFLNQPCALHLGMRPCKNVLTSQNWTLEDIKKAVQFLVDRDNDTLDKANQSSLMLAGVLRKRLGVCKDLSTLIAKTHYDLVLASER